MNSFDNLLIIIMLSTSVLGKCSHKGSIENSCRSHQNLQLDVIKFDFFNTYLSTSNPAFYYCTCLLIATINNFQMIQNTAI